MERIIALSVEISSINCAIDHIRLDNPKSPRIGRLLVKRERLIKELHSLTGKLYHKSSCWEPED